MQQLRRIFPKNVHTQKFQRLPVKQQFQSPFGVPADLPARNLPVIRHSDLIRNVRLRQLLLRLPDKRNLRNGVNPVPTFNIVLGAFKFE